MEVAGSNSTLITYLNYHDAFWKHDTCWDSVLTDHLKNCLVVLCVERASAIGTGHGCIGLVGMVILWANISQLLLQNAGHIFPIRVVINGHRNVSCSVPYNSWLLFSGRLLHASASTTIGPT